jgi:hypothetical protein
MKQSTGQGTPLPEFLKCDGEWVLEGYVYLYYSDTTQSQSGLAPRFTVGASRHDGARCIGFDVAQLAAELGVDSATVLAANHDHTLIYLGTASVPPTHGGTTATAHGFRIGDRKGFLTVERNDREGTA